MPKVRSKRRGLRIDMTPMVDVAFLLLTFFMLTTSFHRPEKVKVELPLSHSALKLPESELLTVTVSSDNRFFMALSSQQARERMFHAAIRPKLQRAGLPPSVVADSLRNFRLSGTFTVQPDELDRFVLMAHVAGQQLRPVIKADAEASFEAVNRVIKGYRKANMLTFNLVTVKRR